jgi:O-antigen/teichoic acid export membrane protein
LATAVSLILSILVSILIWGKYEQISLLRLHYLPLAWPDYWREVRFLFFSNFLGYAKTLHRGSDVLLVSFLAGDHITGLYKLARSLTDTLNILYDALNQVYYPRFMELLAQKATVSYRYLAGRITLATGAFTLLIIILQLLFLEPILRILLLNRFAGAESAIIIMTVPFFFVAGVSIWLWPIFVHSGHLGKYTSFSLLACAVQYIVATSLFLMLLPGPWMAAMGYLAYYIVLYLPAYLVARMNYPAYLPTVAGRIAPA